MKTPLVIFGSGEIAQLAHHYFSTDSSHDVAAFTVDRELPVRGQLLQAACVPFRGDRGDLSSPASSHSWL